SGKINGVTDFKVQKILQNTLLELSKKAARKFIKNSAFSYPVDEFARAINNSTATVDSIDKATEKYMKGYDEYLKNIGEDLKEVEGGKSMEFSSKNVPRYLEFLDFYNQPYLIAFNEKDSEKVYLSKKEGGVFIFEGIYDAKIEEQHLDVAIKEIEELQAKKSISDMPENKQEYNDEILEINGLGIDIIHYITSHPELNIVLKGGRVYYKGKRFTILEKGNKGKAEILGEVSEITKKATKQDRLDASTFLDWISAVDRSVIVQKKSRGYERSVTEINNDAKILNIKSGHKGIDLINDAYRIITKENKEKSNISDEELLQQAAAKLGL
ncbi:hypothetical protein LR004_00700, partial [Candidatus Gracilibacteria bacterium]|nr:hypothetical protein [Candidatus Gracilibacteria bacterium]